MKNFLILIVLFPVVAFGAFNYSDDISVRNMYIFKWTSFGVSSTRVSSPCYYLNSYDEMYSTLTSSIFGFYIRTQNLGATQISFIAPSGSPVFVRGNLNSGNVTNSIYCTTGGVNCCVSPLYFPNLASVYGSVAALFVNGYRGPGIVDVFSGSSGHYCINVDYPALVADVVSSTNTVYRQILLSSLSSISSGVASIAEYTFDSAGYLNSIDLNTYRTLISVGSISNSVRSIDQDMDTLIDRVGDVLDKISSDPFVSDFTNAVNALLSSGQISQGQASSFLSGYSSLSSPTARAVFALSLKDSVNASQFAKDFISTAATSDLSDELVAIGQSLGADVVDALIGDYSDSPTRGGKAVNTRTSIKAQLRSWREEAKQQLQDWKDDLRQQLQDWKTSDETGYLNVRGSIDNVGGRVQDVSSELQRLFDPNGYTSSGSNYVQGGSSLRYVVTNLSASSERQLADLAAAITNSLNSFRDNLLDGDNLVGVRIKYPLRYESTDEVNVHDQDVVDAIRNGYINIEELKSAILEALNTSDPSVHIKGTNSVDWSPWFEKWDPYNSAVTNYYSDYNSSDPVAGLAREFLYGGFDIDVYNGLPWFSRVEVLLAMIADVSTNSVGVADIDDKLEDLVEDFKNLGTNVVSSSESFVGLFDYVKRSAERFKLVFGDRSAPVTGSGITLLSAGHWIGNEPLVLKVDITVQNIIRLFFRCLWLLSSLVVLWLVLSWSWQKVLAVLRWLWSMFDL